MSSHQKAQWSPENKLIFEIWSYWKHAQWESPDIGILRVTNLWKKMVQKHRERSGAMEEVLAAVSTGKKICGVLRIFWLKRRISGSFNSRKKGTLPVPNTHIHVHTHMKAINGSCFKTKPTSIGTYNYKMHFDLYIEYLNVTRYWFLFSNWADFFLF